ncbi:MAG: Bacterial regulatory protein luxR family [Planctomycetota bacterium]
MKPVVLKLSQPEVVSVFADLAVMQRWEVLRRSENPMTPEELAAACRVPVDLIQHSLDRLVDAGLAVRIRASAKSRRTTYRSASTEVVFEYDDRSATERRVITDQREAYKHHGRRILDRAHMASSLRGTSLKYIAGDRASVFNTEEAYEARKIFMDANAALEALEQRAQRRAAAEAAQAAEGTSRGYYMLLYLQELEQPELPLPQFMATDTRGVTHRLAELTTRPSAVLTAREHAIARRLAAGETRPKIAEAIGVSSNTVAAASKRIYEKLGIHSRAELAARMHNA